jgi:hypothetical protein
MRAGPASAREPFERWLKEQLGRISKGATLADTIRYGLNHWAGLSRYLDDGRIEIDSSTAGPEQEECTVCRAAARVGQGEQLLARIGGGERDLDALHADPHLGADLQELTK